MSTITSTEIQAAFDAELTRLTTLGLTPEQEILARRYYSQSERESMDEGSFCGPHRSFPITSQADVNNAAHLIGHADDPAAVKACIKRKAKAHGWSLPESWSEGDGEDRTVTSDAPCSCDEERAQMPTTAMLYAPITRVDKENWVVEGVATSEEVDSFGTIFSFEASKKAFQQWAQRNANVREMHDKKAVGKGMLWWPEDDTKQIHVRCKVSRGAPDTWQKVLDDVLCGFSVGATKPKWQTIERNGKTYPYLVDYELAELSLVDNPSNPDCNFALCRADGLTDLVDTTEPEPITIHMELDGKTIASAVMPTTLRVGAKHSAATRDGFHGIRDHQIAGAMKTMQECGCDDCQKMHSAIDPDGDGDNDLTDGPADTDHDARQLADRVMMLLEQRLSAPIQRMQAIAGTFARSYPAEIDTAPLQGSLEALASHLSSLDEVRSVLTEVKGQVDRIASQPAPGGPVLNGAYPVDKRLATDPRTYPGQPTQADLRAGLDRMQEQGDLQKQMDQLAAAALTLQRFQGRIGS